MGKEGEEAGESGDCRVPSADWSTKFFASPAEWLEVVGGGWGWLGVVGVTHAGTKKLVSFCLTAISHSLQFSQLSVSTTFNTWEGLGKYIIPRLIYAQLAVLYFSQMG